MRVQYLKGGAIKLNKNFNIAIIIVAIIIAAALLVAFHEISEAIRYHARVLGAQLAILG